MGWLAGVARPRAGRRAHPLPPPRGQHRPQAGQPRRILPALGRALRSHGGARRRQRYDRRGHHGACPCHAGQPGRGAHPDGAVAVAPSDLFWAFHPVRGAPAQPHARARFQFLADRQRQLLGPQRYRPRACVHRNLRPADAEGETAPGRRDPEPRLRRGGFVAPRWLACLPAARDRRQLRGSPQQYPGFCQSRSALGPGQPPAPAPARCLRSASDQSAAFCYGGDGVSVVAVVAADADSEHGGRHDDGPDRAPILRCRQAVVPGLARGADFRDPDAVGRNRRHAVIAEDPRYRARARPARHSARLRRRRASGDRRPGRDRILDPDRTHHDDLPRLVRAQRIRRAHGEVGAATALGPGGALARGIRAHGRRRGHRAGLGRGDLLGGTDIFLVVDADSHRPGARAGRRGRVERPARGASLPAYRPVAHARGNRATAGPGRDRRARKRPLAGPAARGSGG